MHRDTWIQGSLCDDPRAIVQSVLSPTPLSLLVLLVSGAHLLPLTKSVECLKNFTPRLFLTPPPRQEVLSCVLQCLLLPGGQNCPPSARLHFIFLAPAPNLTPLAGTGK